MATVEDCAQFITKRLIHLNDVNLVIVDECHQNALDSNLSIIIEECLSWIEPPRIIGLAIPLFDLTKEPGRLGYELERVEDNLKCEVETASDIISVLR